MTESRRPLLVVEDDPALQTQMRWAFDKYETVFASDREAAIVQLRRFEPAVVTMDLGLPPTPDDPAEGLHLLEEIHALSPDTKVIVLTGQNDRAHALRAIAMGAHDFCAKPFEPELLNWTIDRAFRVHELQEENRRLMASHETAALGGIITRDPAMQRTCRTVEKVAPTSATVLILGESGTGKEILARALHELSPRRTKRFVAINCAAIPETLLESELFGYEKGAFTGAVRQTIGKIEFADGEAAAAGPEVRQERAELGRQPGVGDAVNDRRVSHPLPPRSPSLRSPPDPSAHRARAPKRRRSARAPPRRSTGRLARGTARWHRRRRRSPARGT